MQAGALKSHRQAGEMKGISMLSLKDSSLLVSRAYVDGVWIPADQRTPVKNPATGAIVAEVADVGIAGARRAIDAAARAQRYWGARTARDRSAILLKWYQLLLDNADDLARILTAEMGKPFLESKGEIAYGASFIEWFAQEGRGGLWGHNPWPSSRQAHSRTQATDWRSSIDHAMELPERNDRAQGRSGSGSWLHLRRASF